jgi:hypothetical protein
MGLKPISTFTIPDINNIKSKNQQIHRERETGFEPAT